jgi:chorismate mutase / prephenate dehydratase
MSKRKSSRSTSGSPKADDTAPVSVAELTKQVKNYDLEFARIIQQRASASIQLARSSGKGDPCSAGPAALAVPGPLDEARLAAIFREVAAACRDLAAPQRVAYLGPDFTFSHLAALHRFGRSSELVPVGAIAAVFEEVESGNCSFGIVPLENSTDGRISDTLDCISRSPTRICGELPLRVHHCLLGTGERREIRQVHSKPQALSQCRKWLASHLPNAEIVSNASTAEAARLATADRHVAAIASRQAGVEHGLSILAENIEDNADNVTRFAVIGPSPAPRTGRDKTALMFEVPHHPGSLADAMNLFKRNRLNLTWIESFPIPGSGGRYLFFVEFLGHQAELRARRAIAALRKKALRLEVLGSYAQCDAID